MDEIGVKKTECCKTIFILAHLSTTSLFNHLENLHPKQYMEVQQIREETSRMRAFEVDEVACIKAASQESSQTATSNVPAQLSAKCYKSVKVSLIN